MADVTEAPGSGKSGWRTVDHRMRFRSGEQQGRVLLTAVYRRGEGVRKMAVFQRSIGIPIDDALGDELAAKPRFG